MAKTIQQAGGVVDGGVLPTSSEITATTSVAPTKTQLGDKLAGDLLSIVKETAGIAQTGYTVSKSAAQKVANDNMTSYSMEYDRIMETKDNTIEGDKQAKADIELTYQKFGNVTFDNADAQNTFDSAYHNTVVKSASSSIGALNQDIRKKEATKLYVGTTATTEADYLKGGLTYDTKTMRDKERTMTASGDYTPLQAQTSLSKVEIEALNNKFKLKKDLDIYVDGSNYEIDDDKAMKFYNENFGAYSMVERVEYDGDGKKIEGGKIVFRATEKDVDASVVNSQRDAFLALIQKAKKNTSGSLSKLPSVSKTNGQSSEALQAGIMSYNNSMVAQRDISKSTGMTISDSIMTSQANEYKDSNQRLYRTINYEGAVTRIFNAGGGTEYSVEFNDLKNQVSGYKASYYVQGQDTGEGALVNTPYKKSDFDVYVEQEVNKRESIIADVKVDYATRENEVKTVALASHRSDGQIRTPYIDKMYQNSATGMVAAKTLVEAQNQTDLSHTIGTTMRKPTASNWVLDKSLKARADVLNSELAEQVKDGEITEVEAVERYRAFTLLASREVQNKADTKGSRAATTWVKAQDGDIETWNPTDEKMGTGTLRLLNYDALSYDEMTDEMVEEAVKTQTMMVSNDWFVPTADGIRIKTPEGVVADKRGGITDKIFAKLAIELKDTNIVPDDYESSRMNISQSIVNGKTYTYVSVMDNNNKPVAMIAMSDDDLKKGLTLAEQKELAEFKKHKREKITNRYESRPSFGGSSDTNRTTPTTKESQSNSVSRYNNRFGNK